jgi:4a-hydroxytetrahydrobiopterin dehydratase
VRLAFRIASRAAFTNGGNMPDIAAKICEPCSAGTPVLRGERLETLLREIRSEWRLVDEHHLEREYRFKNFRDALAFTNRIGDIAEAIGHHPEIQLTWGKVRVRLWTHKIDGLSENDFVLAARIDELT